MGTVAEDRLHRYREKRDFTSTSEPQGADAVAAGSSRFVIQKHRARRLHYDVRFEVDGVLASWAVPKGPSYDPRQKRLAVHVEDHPLDYATFEGTIPGGAYGAGAVIVWDAGTFANITEKKGQPVPLPEAIEGGHFSVWLNGQKVQGGWSVTRTSKPGDDHDTWIMVKRKDDHADPERDVTAEGASVQSGRDLDEVAADPDSAHWTRATATWKPPMLAELADPNTWADNGEWRYERKLDGLRCVAVRNGDDVEMWSRNHLSFVDRFPDIADALAHLAVDNVTLDGEIVAYDGTDFRGFGDLRARGRKMAAVFAVFDVLHLLGEDTTGLGVEDRTRLLASVVDQGPLIVTVDPLDGSVSHLLERACADGWEGLIAKRLGSRYVSGRSSDWRKLKCVANQELVIGGWTEPAGTRVELGALLVGYHDDTGLRYAGKVGTGFSTDTLHDLGHRLRANERAASPFVDQVKERHAHWVDPVLVAQVTFSEWTKDNKLRHPRYEGLRDDKAAESVRRERPQ